MFFGVVTANISFRQFIKMMLTSADEYFLAIVSNGRVSHGSLLNSVPKPGDFCTRTFHKVV